MAAGTQNVHLPCADMLQRVGDIGFGRSGVHLFGDARRILHDALPHLRIARHIRTRMAHQIPAQDRDDEGADRVRSVPDRHLGRQLLGRNPMRDQAVARREAAPLEHVVQNQQHAEQDDQRMDERRPVGLPRNPCADDRTAAENEVDDRTHRQARHHVPAAVGAVRQYAVDEFRHAVDQPDEGHDDAEGRFRDAVLGRKTGNGEREVLANEIKNGVTDHRSDDRPPLPVFESFGLFRSHKARRLCDFQAPPLPKTRATNSS